MAARPIRPEEFQKALELYCVETGSSFSEGEDHGQKRFLLSPGDIVVRLEEGRIITNSHSVFEKLCEILMDMRQAEAVKIEPTNAPKTAISPSPRGIVPPRQEKSNGGHLVKAAAPRDVQVSELTLDDIKNFICPEANDQEAFMFLKLCQARNLNPFTREAYLIKYGGKANMVVGKDAFTRKAEAHPQFDGFEAGIIVAGEDGSIASREGSFVRPKETLLGGWAKVHRKDRKIPFYAEIGLREYDKGQGSWKVMPATMIRKVALVQALREAFASDLGGMYDQAEIIEAESQEVST